MVFPLAPAKGGRHQNEAYVPSCTESDRTRTNSTQIGVADWGWCGHVSSALLPKTCCSLLPMAPGSYASEEKKKKKPSTQMI